MDYAWYWKIYGANPCHPESYTKLGLVPPNCPGKGKVCSVYAQNNGLGLPIMTYALRAAMITALTLEDDQSTVQLRSLA